MPDAAPDGTAVPSTAVTETAAAANPNFRFLMRNPLPVVRSVEGRFGSAVRFPGVRSPGVRNQPVGTLPRKLAE
ncbi:hypothetical protein Mro03_17840 [Microbispora rosea subsp. rosea]|nr:hypothetical protein Mro03_17840 [Microbispora rosea subsp. rosea]